MFPEVCGWQRWLPTRGAKEGGRGHERAETRPHAKNSFLHSLYSVDRIVNVGNVSVTLENDYYQLLCTMFANSRQQ